MAKEINAKVVRAWAAENGISVPARGRVPMSVVNDWYRAGAPYVEPPKPLGHQEYIEHDPAAVRYWAENEGIDVYPTGKVPQEIVRMWVEAGSPPHPASEEEKHPGVLRLSEYYPTPDPERLLTESEVAAVLEAAAPDIAKAEEVHPPRALEDETGNYVSVQPTKPSYDVPITETVRCAHRNERTGARCKKWAVTGLALCEFHNQFGEATQVLREYVLEYARRDLYRMTPLALDTLEGIMLNEDISPAVRLKAATEALDRIGVRGGTEVQITTGPEFADPAAEIRARLDRLARPAAEITSQSESDADVVDAEIVEDTRGERAAS